MVDESLGSPHSGLGMSFPAHGLEHQRVILSEGPIELVYGVRDFLPFCLNVARRGDEQPDFRYSVHSACLKAV
jgi:hypothetical protein